MRPFRLDLLPSDGSLSTAHAVRPFPMFLFEHALCIAGAITFACAIIARIVVGRCGDCKKRLSRVMSAGGSPWALSRSLRFCPFCAASIDEQLPIDQTGKAKGPL